MVAGTNSVVEMCDLMWFCVLVDYQCDYFPLLRCPVFRKMKEEMERKKKPSWNELKGIKSEGESSADTKHAPIPSRSSVRNLAEPGLINPAYEESEDGMESFH